MANGVFTTEARGLVLVDTSVWIDFLQRPGSNIHEEMTRLIQGVNRVVTRKSTYFLAAEIFRRLRETGLQVQTVDATIAAIAVENRVPLFTLNLRHFIPMCKVSKLRLHAIPAGKL